MPKKTGTEKFESKGLFQTCWTASKASVPFVIVGICFGVVAGIVLFRLYDGIIIQEHGEAVTVIDTIDLFGLAFMSLIVVFLFLALGLGNIYYIRKARSADYGEGRRETVAFVEGAKGTMYAAIVTAETICPECGHAVIGTDPRFCTKCGCGMDTTEEETE
ncbi:MAG: hypothetical protein LBB30_00855 [Candidatus Methanoplasma sp.]|jgi:hypothetical protein|nr:hypothetical protein [Candidatus Methanoplasma sp.]